MKFVSALAVFSVLGLAGLGQAMPAGGNDSSAFTLDLTTALGHKYYIACKGGSKDITHCPSPTIWEDTNKYTGLQRIRLPVGEGQSFDPDHELLS
jgi:hypothetical protein